MKFPHIIVITLLLAGVCRAEDATLKALEARLDAADSQTDLNIASKEVADYLDKQLIAKEAEIAKDLDPEGLRLFSEASKLWRDYRLAQLSFEGDLYRGGSIQPLIHNRAFIRLTRERLSALANIMKP